MITSGACPKCGVGHGSNPCPREESNIERPMNPGPPQAQDGIATGTRFSEGSKVSTNDKTAYRPELLKDTSMFTFTVTRHDLETLSDVDDLIQELIVNIDADVVLSLPKSKQREVKRVIEVQRWTGVELVEDSEGNLRFEHGR